MRYILIGIVASLFFATTFVLNSSMNASGGYWVWSGSLRFFLTVPFLMVIVGWRRNWSPIWRGITSHPIQWLVWSTVGFGFFYAPICFSAAYGPAWLVAASWQITIVAGALLTPFFPIEGQREKQKFPIKAILISLPILFGVVLMQAAQAVHVSRYQLFCGIFPVVFAAFAYPIGNRMMMQLCGGRLDVYQRNLGMTVMSFPFWILLSVFASFAVGGPTHSQITQSLIVALCSGVIATSLFFYATDSVRNHPERLAAVEATQAGELVFSVLGSALLLSEPLPSGWSLVGMIIVIAGMVLHSVAHR